MPSALDHGHGYVVLGVRVRTVGGDEAALAEQDPSTQGLIRYYREQRG